MASKKAVLGRGLNALLPSEFEEGHDDGGEGEAVSKSRLSRYEDRVRTAGRVAEVAIEAVRPNPYQPRKAFDDGALDELAESIRHLGIIQPITVRALGGHQFEIISGERRIRAARRAGLERIPAYIRQADTEQMLEMAIVENIQREELNPIEVALGYQRLIDECGLTQEDVAQKVGKNRTTIANMLRLLKLPARIQASLRDGEVSIGHARALINVEDDQRQAALLAAIRDEALTVRDVEERVRKWREAIEAKAGADQEQQQAVDTPPDRDALQVKAYTSALRSHLSTQVNIKRKADGGTIEIAFYSDGDLERLMELLVRDGG